MALASRKAIYIPFPQAVPSVYTLDADRCLNSKLDSPTGFRVLACVKCEEACQPKAIDFDMQPEIVEREVGAIVVATGFDLQLGQQAEQLGYRRSLDVMDGLEFERMLSASGPTGGESQAPVRRPGSEGRGLHPVCRLAGPGARCPLLLPDLLYVHRQARAAPQAQGAGLSSLRLLHGHPRRRQGLRGVRPSRDGGGAGDVHPRARQPGDRGRRQTQGARSRHPVRATGGDRCRHGGVGRRHGAGRSRRDRGATCGSPPTPTASSRRPTPSCGRSRR